MTPNTYALTMFKNCSKLFTLLTHLILTEILEDISCSCHPCFIHRETGVQRIILSKSHS